EDLTSDDVALVGGKNASLGEMIRTLKERGVRVPDGFATTADAYWLYVEHNDLEDKVRGLIDAFHRDETKLEESGSRIREIFMKGEFPGEVASQIKETYDELCRRYETRDVDVATRSSATAEDLPEASFAGQLETYLNVTGEEELMEACKRCFASLFTNRAISYREEQGFDHMEVALSVGVQKMVRSDKAGSGVMFTIDTDTGFPETVVINAAWGLGENVVQGTVNPDQYTVFKPLLEREDLRPIIGKDLGEKEQKMLYAGEGGEKTKNVDTSEEERTGYVLSDDEILLLARWGVVIEDHYERPMDIEWAKDGDTGELYCVQARPETVHSRKDVARLKSYELKEEGKRLVEGRAIGQAIATGKALVLQSPDEIDRFEEGSILVTEMTDPDWGPIIKKAAGIVTDHGGRTSHAAIVSRELGIAAIVGAGDATQKLSDDQAVTISCVGGEVGYVYEGELEYEEHDIDLEDIPETKTRIMMNSASPGAAMHWWQLPVQGIGLARMEYIVNDVIKIHPMALVHFDDLEDDKAREKIKDLTKGYDDKSQYFVDHLSRGIATIAAAQHPHPVIVRLSDFKTNEYAELIGGKAFEPHEENPMLGWRGASRYYDDDYKQGFALECRALKRVREEMGFENVVIMVPFCRTPEEGKRVLDVMAENGLERGKHGLEVYVMAEIPTNVLQADEFAEIFDGFSIGTNDLTQLVLGVSRDSEKLAALYDESNRSVKRLIRELIEVAHAHDRPVGLCGQAPSDRPEFAEFLVEAGIDSISVDPDSVLDVIEHVAKAE
ncbi:MAG: pyruvate, water dikinase, partial [Bradymonadaceae bacterium]